MPPDEKAPPPPMPEPKPEPKPESKPESKPEPKPEQSKFVPLERYQELEDRVDKLEKAVKKKVEEKDVKSLVKRWWTVD